MNDVNIRDAEARDAPMVAAVHVDTWRTTYRGIVAQEYLDSLSYEKRQQGFLVRLTDPKSFSVVAEDDNGRIIGFACAGPNRLPDSPYGAEIYAVYVLQERQRRGIGRKLVSAVCQRFVRRGLASMAICVLEENAPARSFYERLGGKHAGVQTVTIGQQNLREVIYAWDDIRGL